MNVKQRVGVVNILYQVTTSTQTSKRSSNKDLFPWKILISIEMLVQYHFYVGQIVVRSDCMSSTRVYPSGTWLKFQMSYILPIHDERTLKQFMQFKHRFWAFMLNLREVFGAIGRVGIVGVAEPIFACIDNWTGVEIVIGVIGMLVTVTSKESTV